MNILYFALDFFFDDGYERKEKRKLHKTEKKIDMFLIFNSSWLEILG